MITDEQLDDLFRDWARAEVDVATPPAHLDVHPAELVTATEPRRARWVWLVAAAVVVLVLGGVGWLAFGVRDDAAPAAADVSDLYGHWVYAPAAQGVDVTASSLVLWNWSCSLHDTYSLTIDRDRVAVGRLTSGGSVCSGLASGPTVPTPVIIESHLSIEARNKFRGVLFSDPSWDITDGELILTAPDGESVTLVR